MDMTAANDPSSIIDRPAKGRTVLVVENDEACGYAIARGLKQAGFSAIETSNFAAALNAFEAKQRIDLLVTDAKMQVHGFALARMAISVSRISR